MVKGRNDRSNMSHLRGIGESPMDEGGHYGRNSKRNAPPTSHICPVTGHHWLEKVHGRYDIERMSDNSADISNYMWFQTEHRALGRGTGNKTTRDDAWPMALQKYSCAQLSIWGYHFATVGGNTTK